MSSTGRFGRTANDTISAVSLEGSTLTLLVEHDRLQAAIDRTAAEQHRADAQPRLRELPGIPAGKHPILVDLWQLRDGRTELGGLTQHEWSRLGFAPGGFVAGAGAGAVVGGTQGALRGGAQGAQAGAVGGPVGSMLGAAWGAFGGGMLGALSGGVAGSQRGLQQSGSWGARLSERSAEVLTQYSEVMFSVPGCELNESGPYSFVLGIFADSQLACRLDQVCRYGFGKTPAQITPPGDAWQAEVPGGRQLIWANCSGTGVPPEATGTLQGWLEAPLLGWAPDGLGRRAEYRVSRLARDFTSAESVEAINGAQLALPHSLFGALDAGHYKTPSTLEDGSAAAISYHGVWTEISIPYSIRPSA